MGKVDIKKLKARLSHKDHEKIMEALGIPLYSRGSNCLTYWTGDKNKDPLQGSPKLLYYFDTQIYISYTSNCSYDIISLTQRRLELLNKPASFMDSVYFIMNTIGLETNDVSRIHETKHIYNWEDSLGKFIRFRQNGSTLPSYDKNILNQLEKCYPQAWIDEGISIETMEKYHIGYYERTNSTTIPCFTKEGELCGIRVRNWQPEDLSNGRKYMPLMLLDGTVFKFPTNNTFYGINYNAPEIERTGVVMLAESEKATLKLDTWYGEKNVALSMFGKNLGLKRRNDLIKMGVKHIVYIPDCDYIGKGEEAQKEWEEEIFYFAKQFRGYAQVEIVWDNLGFLGAKENATDRDFETWKELYENREIITY